MSKLVLIIAESKEGEDSNKLKSEVKKNLEYEEIFNTFKIKSYDFNESLFSGIKFVIEGDQEEILFIMRSKKLIIFKHNGVGIYK